MRKVSKSDAESKAREWGCPYVETSAKTRANVEEIYSTIMRLIRDRKSQSAEAEKSRGGGGCCVLM
jgi:Ras-related protein Ral-A